MFWMRATQRWVMWWRGVQDARQHPASISRLLLMSTSGCPGSPATKRANAGLGLACCEVSCEVAKLLGENRVTKRSVGSSQLSPASLGCCQTGGWVGRIAAQVRSFLVAAEWGGTQGDPKDGARALVWAPRRHTALLAVWQGSSYRAEQDSLLTYPVSCREHSVAAV